MSGYLRCIFAILLIAVSIKYYTEATGILDGDNEHARTNNLTYKDESSDLLLNMYRRLAEGHDLSAAAGHATNNSLKAANTVRSFAILGGEKGSQHHFLINASQLIIRNERVSLIELRLRSTTIKLHSRFVFHAKLIRNGRNATKTRKFGRKSDLKVYKDNQDGFHCLDITFLVKRWQRKMRHNDILELVLESESESEPDTVSEQGDLQGRRQRRSSVRQLPLILIFAQNESFLTQRLNRKLKTMKKAAKTRQPKRRKRTTRRRFNKWKNLRQKRKSCNAYDLDVDFSAIGWSAWIVHPKRFNAKLCFGMCHDPLTHEYNPSNHAVMQSLMRIQGNEDVPRTCCVPIKLQPLSMLYYENDQIVLRHHRDLVAGECGCR